MNIFDRIDERKVIIDRLRPFEGQLLGQLKDYYRIGLTYSSNALEGNTLTESETKVLLEDGLTVGGKPLRDTFEALGHAKAYDFMFSLLGRQTIEEADVLTMHKLFYNDIESETAGVYRDVPVFITGSKYSVCKAEQIPDSMTELIEWTNGQRGKYHPVEFAALLHKRFVFIHPFKDGNGRLARLLMNAALIQSGYVPAIIPPILRPDYITLLEKAHQDDKPFIEFIGERVLETEKEIMRLLNIE